MSFRADSQPLAEGKRTVEMAGGRARPGPIILTKECPGLWKGVLALDDGRFAVAWGGGIYSPLGIEIRTLDGIVDRIADSGAPLARTGKYLLSSGKYCDGHQASTRVLEDHQLLIELPVAAPYALSRSGILYGYIRKPYQDHPIVDPALAAPFPELKQVIDAGASTLVGCDLDGKVQLMLPGFDTLAGLALAPDERTLYFAGSTPSMEGTIGAIDVSRREVIWKNTFPEWHRRLALSPDGSRLAVCGMGPLRVLSPEGELLQELRCFGRIDALAYHGRMLMAAGNGKTLFLFDENHQPRDAKVAAAAIQDFAVVKGGVVLACDQRQLRFFPLLDDEA